MSARSVGWFSFTGKMESPPPAITFAHTSRCVNRASPEMTLPLDRQHSQQFQRGLMLVGLGIHPELANDGFDVRGIGRDQVNSRRLAVATATGRLAVDGKVRRITRTELSANPSTHTRLEVGDVNSPNDSRRGGLAEAASPSEPEQAEKLAAPLFTVIRSSRAEIGESP
jgi:hypothetical protein